MVLMYKISNTYQFMAYYFVLKWKRKNLKNLKKREKIIQKNELQLENVF